MVTKFNTLVEQNGFEITRAVVGRQKKVFFPQIQGQDGSEVFYPQLPTDEYFLKCYRSKIINLTVIYLNV